MPEHLIRLRGPWELLLGPDAAAPASRVDLPADALPASIRPVRLRRRFGRPARLPADAPCSVRAESVPGLLEVSINGEALAEFPADAPGSGPIVVPVPGPLRPRNVLELTVAPGPSRVGEAGRPWGAIALAFSRDDGPSG